MKRGQNLSFRGWNARTPMRVDPNDPRGAAVCDGCGWWVNHCDLRRDMQYRGGISPVWTGMLLCSKCYDVPNPAPQFSRLTLYPDPVPLLNPRPQVPAPQDGGYEYWVLETGEFVNTVSGEDTWGGEFVQMTPDWEMTQNGFNG